MRKLTDEILNKYVDGDLDPESRKQVEIILSSSSEDRKNYEALLLIHKQLKKIEEISVKQDFTNRVMNTLLKHKKAYQEQRKFILSISSVFIFLILFIIGIFLYFSFTLNNNSAASSNYLQVVISFFNVIASSLTGIFTPKGLSILGSVLSLGILISGYFFFENLKSTRLKNNGGN